MKRLARVCDLELGDEFKYENTTLVVRVVLGSKIIASKPSAQWPHGQIGLGFHSHKFEDLMNRVELTNNTCQLEVCK